ncbi:MAG: hypothetical protein LRY38_03775 [Aeromonadaceae bacterium]|nr:hypothetical protein [Aeromonadaceae bacterium]
MSSLSPALPLWRRVGYPLRQHWHRLRYQGLQLRQNPTSLLGLGLLLLFGYFIAVPVVSLLLDGVQVQFGDERRLGADTGAWTWHYLERTLFSAVAQSQFWTPLGHTLRIALWVVLLCLLVGGLLAWLLTRSDLPARRWLATA